MRFLCRRKNGRRCITHTTTTRRRLLSHTSAVQLQPRELTGVCLGKTNNGAFIISELTNKWCGVSENLLHLRWFIVHALVSAAGWCDDLERFYLFTARFARLLMCELFSIMYVCVSRAAAIPSWLEHFDAERLSRAAAEAFEIKFSKSCVLLLTQDFQ